MIKLDTEHIYSIDQADEIIEQAVSQGTVTSPQKIKYYKMICAFDIETSSFTDSSGEDDLNKHGIIYCWQFAINGKVIFGRYIMEFVHLIRKLEQYTSKDCKILVFVHSLQFEFQWIRCYFKWDKVFAVAPRKPIFARTEGGVEFRCSYVLSNYALSQLGDQLQIYKIQKLKSLDYDLIRTPQTYMSWEEIQYCIHDVLVVSAYIQECILKERPSCIYQLPLTATGYCRRYTRNKCLRLEGHRANTSYQKLMQRLTLDADTYLQLKDAFQGGFTHASFRFSGKEVNSEKYGRIDSLDFTSSYPYSLLSEKYPMSTAKFRGDFDSESPKFQEYLNYYCCLFDVELFGVKSKPINDHYISLSKCKDISKFVVDNGRVVEAEHIGKITLTELDYKLIRRTYDIDTIKITNLRTFRKDYLPRELILSIVSLYRDKTMLKGVIGKEQEYLNGKALLNSVY